MKQIKIYYEDKPLVQFETEIDDITNRNIRVLQQ